jgi:histidyl-tRNA synthetase
MDYSPRSIKAQFKVADREKASLCLIVGDTELASSSVVVKNLGTGEQTTVARGELVGKLTMMK